MTSTGEMIPEKRIPLFVREGFWRRQFNNKPTALQNGFDLLFGVILGIICFAKDPGFVSRELYWVQDFALLEMLLLVGWLFQKERLKPAGGIVAGALLAGFVFSLFCGLVLGYFATGISLAMILNGFPNSRYSEWIVIYGYVPIITSFVFWRNGFRASFYYFGKSPERFRLALSILIGFLLVPAITGLISLVGEPGHAVFSFLDKLTR